VETLTTTNALLSEDLAISKNTILSLQEENRVTKLRLVQYTSATSPDPTTKSITGRASETKSSPRSSESEAEAKLLMVKEADSLSATAASSSLLGTSPSTVSLSVTDLSKKLHDERNLRAEIEKELEVSVRIYG
jgi:hypothetical protein